MASRPLVRAIYCCAGGADRGDPIRLSYRSTRGRQGQDGHRAGQYGGRQGQVRTLSAPSIRPWERAAPVARGLPVPRCLQWRHIPPPTPGLCCTDAAGPGFISSDALSAPQASSAGRAARPIRSVSNRQHRAGIACTATGRSIRRWVPAPPRLCNTDGTAPAARIPMFTLKFAFTTPVQHTIY